MKWVKLKVIKYVGTTGQLKEKEIMFNAENFAYINTENRSKFEFQIVGDPSVYWVKDQDSINRLTEIMG